MNSVAVFENEIFGGQLGIINNEKYGPLFIGYEVAKMAGYKSPNVAISNLADKYKVKLDYNEANE